MIDNCTNKNTVAINNGANKNAASKQQRQQDQHREGDNIRRDPNPNSIKNNTVTRNGDAIDNIADKNSAVKQVWSEETTLGILLAWREEIHQGDPQKGLVTQDKWAELVQPTAGVREVQQWDFV